MGLHLAHAAAEAVWLEAQEYGDPLEHVEFPRERKPGTRDRDAVRTAMNGAINRRCWGNMQDDGMATRDHSQRFSFLNMAHFEINRFRWESRMGKHSAWREETLARLRRYVLAARRFDKPPLPAPPATPPVQTQGEG